jgi:hypothetical protein
VQNSLIASKVPPSKKDTRGSTAVWLHMFDAFALAPGRSVAVTQSKRIAPHANVPASCSIGVHGRPTAAVRAESVRDIASRPAAGSIGVHGQLTAAVRAESLDACGDISSCNRHRAMA